MSSGTAWHRGVVCALDFESTAVDPKTARIVTACWVELHPGEAPRVSLYLINPGVPIPPETTAIHGITDEQAQTDGAPPAEVLTQLMRQIDAAWTAGWPVIGHNLGGYDLTLLEHELGRNDLGSVLSHGGPGMVVDTLCIDKGLRPRVKGKGARKLQACADHYQVRLDGAHDAQHDAIAAARIAWRMCEAFPEQMQIDLHELMDRQQRLHHAWAEDFGGYLKSIGKYDDVCRVWPYQPAQQVVPA